MHDLGVRPKVVPARCWVVGGSGPLQRVLPLTIIVIELIRRAVGHLRRSLLLQQRKTLQRIRTGTHDSTLGSSGRMPTPESGRGGWNSDMGTTSRDKSPVDEVRDGPPRQRTGAPPPRHCSSPRGTVLDRCLNQVRLNINWLSGMAKRGELSRASVELHIDQDDLGAVLVFDRALCSLSTNSFSVIPKSGMHLTQLSKVTAVVCLSRTTSSRPKPMRMPA